MKISLDLLQPDGLWTIKYQHTTYNQEEAFKVLHFIVDGEKNYFEPPATKQVVEVRGVEDSNLFWSVQPDIIHAATMGVYESTKSLIEAIKFYRAATGAGLKEAKDCVEGMLFAADA